MPDTRFDRWRLCARDASNGLKLWEREMPDWGPDVWEAPRYWSSPPTLTRRLVAIGERVFVTLGYKAPVSVLDASTGEVLKTLGQTTNTDEILWSDSVLIVRRRKKIPASTGGHTWDTQVLPNDNNEAEIPSVAVGEQTIMAVDPESGETLWKWPETQMVTLSLAAHNGRVCYHNFEQIVCLDLETGKKLWSVDSPAWPERMGTAGTLVMHGDMVLYTNDRDLQAISASKGEIEWRGPRIIQSSPWQPPDLLVADSLIWGSLTPSAANNPFPAVRSPYASLPPNPWFRQSVDEAMEKRIQSPKEPDWLQGPEPKGINPNTGKIERVIDMGNLVTQGHHVRCYRSKATDNYLLYNKRGIEFVGIKEGTDHARCNWTRGECFYGVLPANGLVYVPPHPCACFPATLMNGFLAYASDHGEKKDKTSGPGLKKGPAYEKVDENAESSTASEWPFYRHDPERTGTAGCSVPANLSVSWRAELKGDLTAPVIANDRLFVFTKDNHTLHCLDAQTGSLLWKKTVDGGVDTPPTIYNGLTLFGCNDGSVYCLRASDGALVWQFRAAPGERLIMDEGQLESPWPVHGNVLVIDSLAYFAAGRSSFLDGGIRMYAIRPGTGEIVHQTRVEGPRLNYIEENGGESTKFPAPIHQSYNIQKANGHPYSQEGAKSHLLVTGANKNHIYMGQKAFKLNLEEMELSMPPTGLGRKKLGLHLASQSGFLDDTWFHRTSWRYTRYWPGHTFGSSVPRSGQILVFDKNTTYALRAFNSGGRGGSFMAEEKSGYILCADDNDIPLKSTQESHGLYIERTQPSRWEQKIPVRANAMVLAEDVLFLAGPPNVFPENDPYAALEGRKGARLWAMSIKDGEKLHSYKIENLPVFDGMAAAYNRLYISAHNGEVMCLAPNG